MTSAVEYKVIFGTYLDSGRTEANIYLDNIKLVTR